MKQENKKFTQLLQLVVAVEKSILAFTVFTAHDGKLSGEL
jgi:hypothetical protein